MEKYVTLYVHKTIKAKQANVQDTNIQHLAPLTPTILPQFHQGMCKKRATQLKRLHASGGIINVPSPSPTPFAKGGGG